MCTNIIPSPEVPIEHLAGSALDLTLKLETFNPVRSFKIRGTEALVGSLGDARGREIICASAGNFGQALALSGRARGFRVTVFAPVRASAFKLARMRQLGARVLTEGRDFDEAKTAAMRMAERTSNARFVEDGREPELEVGAGRIAEELLESSTQFDAVLIPVGNGSLANGMGAVFRKKSPKTRIIGVCATGAPAMALSWKERRVCAHPAQTIAGGLAVRVPVPEAVERSLSYLDEFVLVEDSSLLQAMRSLFEEAGIVSEPSGAAGPAAILQNPERFSDMKITTVITGSNISFEEFEKCHKEGSPYGAPPN